jgi:hypothetical protein
MDEKNTILFLGDVVPYMPVKFRNTHKTVINLECPIIKEGKPVNEKINLSVKENYLSNIFNTNLICASLGNNHILDFGKNGLESTLTELLRLKIQWFGLNSGSDDENHPLIFEFNKIKIAFISVVCQSTSPVIELDNVTHLSLLDLDKIANRVLEIRSQVRRVVVYIHWGIEESSYPSKEDILIARKLIESGVDIIIGSHAHAPQAIEKYKNGIIAYNLGNFLMPEMKEVPSYFDENGIPNSTFSKSLMLWNRISWGLIIDMENMEYEIKKYIFLFNRIIELPVTPLDSFIKLNKNVLNSSYESIVNKHLNKREFFRRIKYFTFHPHVPQKIKQVL